MLLTVYGATIVTLMMLFYVFESRSHWFTLAFAVTCLGSAAYGFLASTWPFGVVEKHPVTGGACVLGDKGFHSPMRAALHAPAARICGLIHTRTTGGKDMLPRELMAGTRGRTLRFYSKILDLIIIALIFNYAAHPARRGDWSAFDFVMAASTLRDEVAISTASSIASGRGLSLTHSSIDI